jgi:hypothetical protein
LDERYLRSTSSIIGWYFWAAAVSGILIYFSTSINQDNADRWQAVHRDHLQLQPLHIVSGKTVWDSQHRQYQLYDLANEHGVIVTSEGLGNQSGFHIGSVLWAYRIKRGVWFFPDVDKPVPKWVVVVGLSFVWIVVLLITLLRIKRRRRYPKM